MTDESGMEKRKVIYRLDPDTAPAIKMAFELYSAGRGGKHIADVLTSHGFRSRNDKPISKSSILNWLRVPFVYAGCRVWNVSHWQKNDAGQKVNRIFHPREEWVIIPDSHPAIIKMEDAEQAYQNMQKNNPNNPQRRMGQRAKYLLAGLANCNHCGHNLQMKYNRRNGEAYYCCGYRRLSQANCDNRRHYNQDLIEDTVMEMMDEFLLQEGYIENQLQHQLEQVEKQEIEARIDTSLELLVDGRVPKERVIIKMQQDEQRLRDLQDKIIKVEEIKAPTAEDLEVFRNQLRSKVEGELDMDTKKSVLNSLIKKWKVDQDGLVEIDFCVALGNTP
ncbi:MAG: recombinase family protein [Candidatus Poribacteria bacterium]|nr:recombinase family protein [Candidatus Poribacteria bacterium]MDP6747571.1 recombinase family protein [Candidatus Poribacteria bacterium]MDP6998725.1 recombinase family protein [Candidatus Poribacteria bacterium]